MKPKIKKNMLVFWNDPAIDDYDEKDRQTQLNRVFTVVSINSEMALISEVGGGSEAEVLPSELVPVQNKTSGSWVVLEWSDNILDYDPAVMYQFGSRKEAWDFAYGSATLDRKEAGVDTSLDLDPKRGRIELDVYGERYYWQVKELVPR